MNCPKCGKPLIDISFYPKMSWNNAIHEIKTIYMFPKITKSCTLPKDIYPEDELKQELKKERTP